MRFVSTTAVIQVDMSVSRYRMFPEDGMVEVWGHVGDYEVCIHLPIHDAQARGLVPDKTTKRRKSGSQEG